MIIQARALLTFLLCIGFNSAVASENNAMIFDLPLGVSIAVPSDWQLMNESQLRQYERSRDDLLEREGIAPAVSAVNAPVPIQAMKGTARSHAGVMMTYLPGEATQEELIQWSKDGSTIQSLGELLSNSQSNALAAAGARDISTSNAELVNAGNKKAVFFSMEFTGPEGLKLKGDKYFIYTKELTVILSFQTTETVYDGYALDKAAIVSSLSLE